VLKRTIGLMIRTAEQAAADLLAHRSAATAEYLAISGCDQKLPAASQLGSPR
jgi:hypothetical protein